MDIMPHNGRIRELKPTTTITLTQGNAMKTAKKMTVTWAAYELDEIRNELARWGSLSNFEELASRCDAVGHAAAAALNVKWTEKWSKVCREASDLRAKLYR
jgi:uncharacterized protein YxjI